MSISGKDKEGTDRSILENNNKNNSKNNSDNRNNNSTQFKVAFITQAAAIAALYVVLVILFNYCSFGPIQFRIAEALTILPYFYTSSHTGTLRRLSVIEYIRRCGNMGYNIWKYRDTYRCNRNLCVKKE